MNSVKQARQRAAENSRSLTLRSVMRQRIAELEGEKRALLEEVRTLKARIRTLEEER